MELKGSKTEQNLMTAFAGESQARNKYSYYASKAKKEGYVQIANIFEHLSFYLTFSYFYPHLYYNTLLREVVCF